MNFRILFSLATVVFSLTGMGVQAQSGDKDVLIQALQQGGYVVYMRHADTTGEPLDRTRDLTNRALQRNLSENGRAQAESMGAAIGRLKLKVDQVAASPVFRARDTAELAFGAERVEIDPWLIADDYVYGGYSDHISMLRQYLATPPDAGNTWLVGHVIPISIATSSEISRSNFPEGAAAVFLPKDNGFELIGILGNGWEESD